MYTRDSHFRGKTLAVQQKAVVPQPQYEKFGKLLDSSRDRIAVGGHRG